MRKNTKKEGEMEKGRRMGVGKRRRKGRSKGEGKRRRKGRRKEYKMDERRRQGSR